MKSLRKILLAFGAVLILNNSATAQVAVQNTGIAYVSSSSDIFYINGSLTNASGASLTNNGNLYVKGDVTNNQALMVVGTGTLYLNGTSMQTIAGAQTFKTYNLVTNNSAGFTINNNLSVSGLHTYTGGLIATSATPNYLVYEAGSSYTGDNDSRHVNGWVKKFGSTDFIFPVGNSTYERTIALTNLTASGEFNVSHYDGPTPNRLNLFSPIVLIDTNEYWTINKISGASANVAMNWDNTKIPIPQVLISGIRAGYYDGSFWRDIGGSATGSVATTGNVTSNSVSAFNNYFTIASTAYVLPLDIISFTGANQGAYNRLNWSIGNEVNVLHYELQRSTDAVNFTTINMQAAKNAGSVALYTYDDVAAVQSKVYYRLKCLDNNGQIKYSGIILIQLQDGRKDFYVIKNPVSDKIDIFASDLLKGNYNYTIANGAGQVVQSGTLTIGSMGVYTIRLQGYLARGIYMLVLRNADNILQKSILKE